MLKYGMTTALTGGKILALGALMGSAALAQTGRVIEGDTTLVETPSGNAVIVPGEAAEPATPQGAVTEPDYPLLEQLDNDEEIARTLIAQGFTDLHILREGPILTVNAQRGGQPVELVYSIANGSLISVDGVELRPAPDDSGRGGPGAAGAPAAPDDAAAPGEESGAAGDDGAPGETGSAGEAGVGDGADGDAGDGSDGAAAGASGGSASDAGAGDAGASDGADGGSDGASDGGGAGDSGAGADGGDAGQDG